MKVFLILLFTLQSLTSFTQVAETNSSHGIGLNLGTISGTGLSYRYQYQKFAAQFTAFGSYRTVRFMGNAGLSVMYSFHSNDETKFYIGASARLRYFRNERLVFNAPDLVLEKISIQQINTGINVDLLRSINKKMNANISIGYGFYNIRDGFKETNIAVLNHYFGTTNLHTMISVGVGVFYLFGK